MPTDITPSTCRYCACTPADPCPGGCTWADETRTLCSRCDGGVIVAATFLNTLRGLAFTHEPRQPVPAVAWVDLPLEHQRPLVQICLTVAETWIRRVADSVHIDAFDGADELARVRALLATAGVGTPDEPITDTVARLIARQQG